MMQATNEPVDLVFMDNAAVFGGIPANFKSVINTCQVSPLVQYAAPTGLNRDFRHCRMSDLRGGGYLVFGLFGNPQNWLGHQPDRSDGLAARIPDLRPILDVHPKLKILLDYSWEAGMGPGFFELCDDVVTSLRVDPARVVVLVSNFGAEARYRRYLLERKIAPANAYGVVGLDLFLLYSAAAFMPNGSVAPADMVISQTEVESLSSSLRSRKFLSLNRRPRWHRFMLALMIGELGARDQGFISMPSPSYEGDWRSEDWRLAQYGAQMEPELWRRLQNSQATIFASLPWIVDINVDHSGHTSQYGYQNQNRDAFLDSYIQIVTETNVDGALDDICITEKTCKALGNLQPFILFGTVGTLARLERLGFEKPGIVPTAYDAAHQTGDRLTRLYGCLEQLTAMPLTEVHAWYYDNLPVTLHNRNRLFQMRDHLGAGVAARLREELAAKSPWYRGDDSAPVAMQRSARFRQEGGAAFQSNWADPGPRGWLWDAVGLVLPSLAICAIVKDEAKYLLEWVAYHSLLGVERFRIYDHGSTDGSIELLEDLGRTLPIEVITWTGSPYDAAQRSAYIDGAHALAGQADFVAFIDVDEFLTTPGNMSLRESLGSFPAQVGAVAVSQRVFGSAGLIDYDPDLVIARFRMRAPLMYPEHIWFKTIARPERVTAFTSAHSVALGSGDYVMSNNEPLVQPESHGGVAGEIVHGRVRLNHYILKSAAEYAEKQSRWEVFRKNNPMTSKYDAGYFRGRDARINVDVDDDLLGIADRVRQEVANLYATLNNRSIATQTKPYYRFL